ncbi:CatB-related O-acetyltransferase [Roseicella aquatilis]|uniref:CatB-related O-acetyltransferase n=1 Tax=Roseicella aquatilis TaxID=2527868 RepID=A0A4R4DH13_9PROT|nr:CatB-related O-acetyltransferase [Roseicella aquatilis]TCZ59838.1 CatB-related O-acetyltransferase [Roseicella aquatilis]
MTPELYRKLAPLGVTTAFAKPQDIHLNAFRRKPMLLEAPIQLRAGRYDVDAIGAFTYLGGSGAVFRHISSIGRFCAIAGSVITGSTEHPTNQLSPHPIFQGGWEREWPQLAPFYSRNMKSIAASRHTWFDQSGSRLGLIRIGNDVWIGESVYVRRGVTVGDGAIIASRSVVVSDIEPYMIVGGVPARAVRRRVPERVAEHLLSTKWWDYGLSALEGCDFRDAEGAGERIAENIASGRARPWKGRIISVQADEAISIEEGDPFE